MTKLKCARPDGVAGEQEMEEVAVQEPHVYPDGGYGWVIVFATSINGVVVLQIIGTFGLIFKDLFRELNMPATDIATIMNINLAFSMVLGIFTGAFVRRFGYRKMAVTGGVFAGVGLLLTTYSYSFLQFILSFGFIMASGVGFTSPAFTVALNSYFRVRRSLATGLAMTATGIIAILLPQVISVLLREYGARGTCMLFAGLSLNSLVAASLLQPVHWHRPKHRPNHGPPEAPADSFVATNTPDTEDHDEADPMLDKVFTLPALPVLKEETDYELKLDYDQDYDLDRSLFGPMRRRTSTASSYHTARRPSECSNSLWTSDSILDLGCSIVTLDQVAVVQRLHYQPTRPGQEHERAVVEVDKMTSKEPWSSPNTPPPSRPTRCWKGCGHYWRLVVDFFDLGLLVDPSMVILMVGVSIAMFSEANFTQFVPFILADRGMDNSRIANLMSLMAVADTVSKLAAPFIQAALRQSSRFLFAVALAMLVAGRTALVLVHGDVALMLVILVLGTFKGLRTIFFYLVIPDSVPHERLAAAVGLQAVINGIIFLAVGPLVGSIRDLTGSYDLVIMTLNALTVLCIAMWGVEYVFVVLARQRGSLDSKK